MSGNSVVGNRTLISGAGNDTLYGDAEFYIDFDGTTNADTLVFLQSNGRDIFGDFEDDKDLIDVGDYGLDAIVFSGGLRLCKGCQNHAGRDAMLTSSRKPVNQIVSALRSIMPRNTVL